MSEKVGDVRRVQISSRMCSQGGFSILGVAIINWVRSHQVMSGIVVEAKVELGIVAISAGLAWSGRGVKATVAERRKTGGR